MLSVRKMPKGMLNRQLKINTKDFFKARNQLNATEYEKKKLSKRGMTH